MKSLSALVSPMRIVAFTTISLLAYLLWRGPERFYYESFGTWIISPVIYTRILPVPWKHWLLQGLVSFPSLSYVLYAVPVLMLCGAVLAAVISIRRHALLPAFASSLLIALVFGLYHYLQPLGMTFVPN